MEIEQEFGIASSQSIHNRAIIERSVKAACYDCCCIFEAAKVQDYVDEEDDTALCPICGMDAVLGDASGLPIEDTSYIRRICIKAFKTLPITLSEKE